MRHLNAPDIDKCRDGSRATTTLGLASGRGPTSESQTTGSGTVTRCRPRLCARCRARTPRAR